MSDKVLIGDYEDKIKTTGTLVATIEGEKVEVEFSSNDTLLDALVKAGHTPPYSCMAGSCMACMAKVVEGQVFQKDEGILGSDNIANDETLSCQAHPLTDRVEIIYEEE